MATNNTTQGYHLATLSILSKLDRINELLNSLITAPPLTRPATQAAPLPASIPLRATCTTPLRVPSCKPVPPADPPLPNPASLPISSTPSRNETTQVQQPHPNDTPPDHTLASPATPPHHNHVPSMAHLVPAPLPDHVNPHFYPPAPIPNQQGPVAAHIKPPPFISVLSKASRQTTTSPITHHVTNSCCP